MPRYIAALWRSLALFSSIREWSYVVAGLVIFGVADRFHHTATQKESLVVGIMAGVVVAYARANFKLWKSLQDKVDELSDLPDLTITTGDPKFTVSKIGEAITVLHGDVLFTCKAGESAGTLSIRNIHSPQFSSLVADDIIVAGQSSKNCPYQTNPLEQYLKPGETKSISVTFRLQGEISEFERLNSLDEIMVTIVLETTRRPQWSEEMMLKHWRPVTSATPGSSKV